MPKAVWYYRIKSGEVTVCPACGSKLKNMRDDDQPGEYPSPDIFYCSNDSCCWEDELADFADNGWYTPPPGWKV